MKRIFFKKIAVLGALLFSFTQIAQAGIIPSNIWFSKDLLEEGDAIKIYTAVYNPDTRELSGSMVFFDGTTFLGKNDFKVSGKSVSGVSIDWKVTVGDHTIFAKIENARFKKSDGTYEDTYIVDNKTEESRRNISKKIDVKETASNLVNSVADSGVVSDLKKTISDNTPSSVPKIIGGTADALETIRGTLEDYSNSNKISVQDRITALNENQTMENKLSNNSAKSTAGPNSREVQKTDQNISKNVGDSGNAIEKPFKYVELFFLSALSFIAGNKIVFYLTLFLLVFLLFRFFWSMF